MNLFDRLGPAVAREHREKREVVSRALCLGPDAADQLARQLRRETDGTALVLFDCRTRDVVGPAVIESLSAAGFSVREALVEDPPGGSPVCDDVTLRALQDMVSVPDVSVGVGSGVISDLSKWLAFEAGVPAAVFGTAASMNGYAAANVAPAIDGVKALIQARAHTVIAADTAVLARAPQRLTTAGLGDVIAKSVSTSDWRMNHTLFGEPYSDAIASILDDVEKRYLDVPRRLATGDHEAVSALFEALVYSGCAMTLQGSSLPASGGEHLISHALDMRADAEGSRHDLHGRQVGVATIFVAALYERILAIDSPRLNGDALPFDEGGWGRLAPAVHVHYRKQSDRLAQAARLLREEGRWASLRETFSEIVPAPGWVKNVLSEAGAAHRVSDLGISRERFLWAVLNGAQMRERFTSLDLAWTAGLLPDAAEEIVQEWLE
jgi:glycerol-1-phosphate dehydrogenase [NAD(P)+]